VKTANEAELAKADVILVQSFGLRSDSSGKSNHMLAAIVYRLHHELHIPIIAQHEVADYLPEPPLYVIQKHRVAGEYLDTFEVMAQSYDVCVQHAFTNPIIVAHPDHQWRVMKVSERFGLHPLAADVTLVPYDWLSIQWWTRRKAFFIFRELLARLKYWKEGKI
jgi:hypothetical protein